MYLYVVLVETKQQTACERSYTYFFGNKDELPMSNQGYNEDEGK